MKTLITTLILILTASAIAQSSDIRVGLVLSGGGAKGMAHVGALKIIEEAGIRIDYIGGSSMGALVGGLYAYGYSAKQIEQFLLDNDLRAIISDEFPRKYKSFPDKYNSERYALTFPFTGFKIRFPHSLSRGQNIYGLMVQLFDHARKSNGFDELPIPFYCSATNLETGKLHIFESGSLPLSINASLALPTLFSPVAIDDQLYIDGGISDNYPIDHMNTKNVDVIIGLDVQSGLMKQNEIKTLSDILIQLSAFETYDDMQRKREETDIYINPNIEEYGILSFDAKEELIAAGETAALQQQSLLETLAKKQKPHTKRKEIDLAQSVYIDAVKVNNLAHFKKNYIKGKLRLTTPGILTYEKIKAGMTNLAATQNFESFRYTFVKENNENNLYLDLKEVSHHTSLRIGVHFDDLYRSSVLLNMTRKQFMLKNDELSMDFIIGDNFRYDFNYFIDKGYYWSIGLNAKLNQFVSDFDLNILRNVPAELESDNKTEMNVYTQENSFYIETLINQKIRFGAGMSHEKHILRTTVADLNDNTFIFIEDSDYFNSYGFLNFDSRDDIFYPTSGGVFNGNFKVYFSENSSRFNRNFESFAIAQASFGFTFPLSKKLHLSHLSSGGFTVHGNDVNSFDFLLGGYGNHYFNNYIPFMGYEPNSFGGNSFLKSSFYLDFEFQPKHHIKFTSNISLAKDDLFNDGSWFKTPEYTGYGIGYGLETFFGPIELTWSYSPENKQPVVFFNAGWWF